MEPLWLGLQSRADASFFQSWAWIGLWLELICPAHHARLLTLHDGDRLVGLGIFTARCRFGGLGPLHLRLHEVGDRVLDSLTIEYNGLLCEKGYEHDALLAAIKHLEQTHPRWLTLYFPGLMVDNLPLAQLPAVGLEMRLRKTDTRYVDLATLRANGNDYLSSLSSANTRSSLRRTARKLAATHGEIHITAAKDTQQRLAFFHELVVLHQAYWTGKAGQSGAFHDRRIVDFHEQLIANASPEQGAQLLRLDAGGQTVGYVYNMVWYGTVYFYQAGVDYPRFKDCGSPGLLLLGQAVQLALQCGHDRFEFMAGDSRYKHELGTAKSEMAWLTLDRAGLYSHLRKAWRQLRGTVST
jgi:CelD/BcsL family acetyltransferase involved in cellulose biosynthesis